MRGKSLLACALLLVACGGSKKPAKGESKLDFDAKEEVDCIETAKKKRHPPDNAPSRIDIAHIVVRHVGLRDAGTVTRSRGEACVRAEQARRKLLGGADWDQTFETYSDSKDSTKGTFDNVSMADLEDDFANAAFELRVNELSHVIETEHGFHVIWRSR
jgi:peptidyl-prolyl cis-trans isomerase NIMA-interacting 1